MKLPKTYVAKDYETDIYALWEKSGTFKPRRSGQPYSIVMPPPNANADLHIGYELTAVLEDIASRYHRAKGESVLLLPGADHAGFETQSVYEKRLAKEGKSRFDFTREELYQQIWDFVALNRGNFTTQMRKMGISCDWNHFTFTLDDKIISRAYQTFKKMWDEGLIYRGERLVNFCTFHGTAFADIEVVHKEEKGHLWYINYPLVDGSGDLTVATTRPETMLGDTAVAVNPKDDRYERFVGKTVRLPLTHREIPVITDEFVDIDYGTGAVKVTPAHDFNDFDIGKRHDLPSMSIIDHEGKLVDVPEPYLGLSLEEGRQRVVGDLEEQGALVKTADIVHSVGHCYKCDTVIQPLLREQWFVDMKPLAKKAIEALGSGKVTFYPEGKKQQLINYLEGLYDWNISRQIAWGIPIPAYQNVDDPDDWIYDERVSQEIIKVGDKTYRRDPDVFDTWFSSSSWPYATLDFPDSEDFKNFYPLSLMETGGEILYPWVSRMLMLGLYVTGEVPFREVYIHGYIMAEDGSKMSKSLGNVVNPMPLIEDYGSDALRMGIISGRVPAVNRGYDSRRVEEARNFCNKVWNISRFIEGIVGDDFDRTQPVEPSAMTDHWILAQLKRCQASVCADLDGYRFAEAYETLYHFVWDDLADWYIEASKAEPKQAMLGYLLESILVLLHPFAPFVTETIWQTLAWENDSILASRELKPVIDFDDRQARQFSDIQSLVSEIRFILKTLRLTGVTLYHDNEALVSDNSEVIKRLAGLAAIDESQDKNGLELISTEFNCWLNIDKDAASDYVKELKVKTIKQEALVKQLEGRLANTSYTDNAPETVVDQTRAQLEEAKLMLSNMQAEEKRFGAKD